VVCAGGEGKCPFLCLHNLSHLSVFENIIMEVSDDLANLSSHVWLYFNKIRHLVEFSKAHCTRIWAL
jgi:hypothetical protein